MAVSCQCPQMAKILAEAHVERFPGFSYFTEKVGLLTFKQAKSRYTNYV